MREKCGDHAAWIASRITQIRYDVPVSGHVRIIGVLNVTPDSFYDGSRSFGVEEAIARAEWMLHDGADIIELGGESTGPGSSVVSLEEERHRVIPALEAIRKAFPHASIAVDTCKAKIAAEAIAAGVTMINDVTAGRNDPAMFTTVAGKADLVLMYSKDPTPRTTKVPKQYEDVIATIHEFLAARKKAAIDAGVPTDRIILDPGLGHFVSADPQYSFKVIAELQRFADLQCPLLLSPSRKSFIAGPDQLGVGDRLPGTIAASAIAVLHGASFIRTHDVLAVKRACEIAEEVRLFS